MQEEYTRTNISLPTDLAEEVTQRIPRGMRNTVMTSLLREYLSALSTYGPVMEIMVREGDFVILPSEGLQTEDKNGQATK